MKNKKVNVKIILIIVLIGIIGTSIWINLNKKNPDIQKQIEGKEQLTETTSSNAYVTMATHLAEVNSQASDVVTKGYIFKNGIESTLGTSVYTGYSNQSLATNGDDEVAIESTTSIEGSNLVMNIHSFKSNYNSYYKDTVAKRFYHIPKIENDSITIKFNLSINEGTTMADRSYMKVGTYTDATLSTPIVEETHDLYNNYSGDYELTLNNVNYDKECYFGIYIHSGVKGSNQYPVLVCSISSIEFSNS